MKSKILGLLAIGIIAISTSATATPVIWDLAGVQFDDGATASGWFLFDADTNTYLAGSISVAGGSVLSPFTYEFWTYDPGNSDWNIFNDPYSLNVVSFVGDRSLALLYARPLPSKGGTVPIVVTAAGVSYECGNNCSLIRNATSGFVTNEPPVPEPGTLALFGLGLAGLRVTRRREA